MFRARWWTPIFLLLTSGLLLPVAFSQDTVSLGEVARQNRARSAKKSAKVFTNDDLAPLKYNNGAVEGATGNPPSQPEASATANYAGASKKPAVDKRAKSGPQAKGKSGEASSKDDPPDGEEPASAGPDWQGKLQAQKDQLAILQRELSGLQQDYQTQATRYYADPSVALRDPKTWEASRKDSAQQIADKQKQVDEASKALDDLREQARRAGAPSGLLQP